MTLKISAIRGWLYQAKLEDLHEAYRAARKSSDGDRTRLEKQWTAFKADVDAGTAEMYEEDEYGQVIYDYGEHFGEAAAEIDSVLSLVRQAFVISLHHFWEREVNKFMKLDWYKAEKAYQALEAEGLPVQRAELERLRLTCNVAKHSGGFSADELFSAHPDMFKLRDPSDKAAYDNLIVTDADVESFFSAVRTSGFQRPSAFENI